ncbi:MAG: hypothetical protein J6O50_03115 [Ruminiclostridium sp.]|nr:hypothetical protein [Ruminiclostridium sp.]
MQKDFHYYATYCAAYLAGYTHDECMEICYSAQLVDHCSATLLRKIKAPAEAATTQLQLELMDIKPDIASLQNITRIWASFHFLPADLYAVRKGAPKMYHDKYRLICNTNSDLLVETVKLAKDKGSPAAGIAMHVLADTWAHRYFAGTPSFVINNTDYYFYELVPDGEGYTERPVKFIHNPSAEDDPENGVYVNSLHQNSEISVMNLGHGRAGHLPDYSYARYKYLPAWGDYEEIVKDNPSDYMNAFCQMIYALKYLRGAEHDFEKDRYDTAAAETWRERIKEILEKRQTDACEDWKKLGEEMSGIGIVDFDIGKYQDEYTNASDKDNTFLGRFTAAAIAQKRMVTNRIYKSGNKLAGVSVVKNRKKGGSDE